MRAYNLDPARTTKLNFYGFDIPSGNAGVASPGKVLSFVVDYLGTVDADRAEAFRENIRKHLGDDAAWENSAVYMDPSKSIALSPSAAALRVETEELIAELRSRRPELVAAGGDGAYHEALRHAEIARELLNFHAAMGSRKPGQSPAVVLGTRDASMADNLVYIADRERPRGKVLVLAHNSHLQRGLASWPGQKYWGTDDDCEWWPAGAHLAEILGPRYAVIASAVGVSPDNGIGEPEPGTPEAMLAGSGHDTLLVAIRGADFGDVPTRTGSTKNPTYVPLNAKAGTNFDWIAWFANTTTTSAVRHASVDAKPPDGNTDPGQMCAIYLPPKADGRRGYQAEGPRLKGEVVRLLPIFSCDKGGKRPLHGKGNRKDPRTV